MLRLVRGARRPKVDFFLRAESYFNVASEIEALDREPGSGPPIISYYGGVSLHEKSHGEAFLWVLEERFGPNGLYILDEPEAALSPQRQLAALAIFHRLVRAGSQLVIATHSPILFMGYPGARLYRPPDGSGIARVAYEDTETVTLYRSFLAAPGSYHRHLRGGDS